MSGSDERPTAATGECKNAVLASKGVEIAVRYPVATARRAKPVPEVFTTRSSNVATPVADVMRVNVPARLPAPTSCTVTATFGTAAPAGFSARTWTAGILAVSAVATGITGIHLAADHAAALAAGTGNPSGTSSVAPTQQGEDDGFTLFGDDGEGDDGSGSGFSSPGQLGSGSGAPHVMSHGS